MDIGGFNMDVAKIDPNFEPQQFRSRSNTWPLRPKEFVKEEVDNVSTPSPTSIDEHVCEIKQERDPLGLNNKKSGSRRNAWGNLSYADLITKAIQTSPEQRLTLSQIYDWMVQNVPYFKDKGDSNSSAGWKNSIRHNLSLHNRFMRIQNEGTGKSSWWVINPDAKPGKTPRRRATSMDTKAYEKKRGRVKKKVEQMRAALEGLGSNPASEYGDSTGELSHLADTFNLSPQDFRARTSSNASSIGRLSPIHAGLEPDLQDVSVAPLSPWNQPGVAYQNQDGFTETTLTDSLAEMFVGDTLSPNGNASEMLAGRLSSGSPQLSQLSPVSNYPVTEQGYLPPPPLYGSRMQTSPSNAATPTLLTNTSPLLVSKNSIMAGNTSPETMTSMSGFSKNMASPMGGQMRNLNTSMQQQGYMSRPAHSLSELLQQDNGYRPDSYMSGAPPQYSSFQTASANMEQLDMNNSLLRQALGQKQMVSQTGGGGGQLSPPLIAGAANQGRSSPSGPLPAGMQRQSAAMMRIQQQLMNGGTMQQTNIGGPISGQCCMPIDLEFATFSDMNPSEIECDVDQIIKHELSVDGSLEFNFDGTVNDSGQCNSMTTLTL